MKKILISVFAILAIASFGGIVAKAHAQTSTLTPAQAAELQAELIQMHAELAQLKAQAAAQSGTVTPSANGTMSSPAAPGSSLALKSGMTLTDADIASIQTALTLLSSSLKDIQSEIASDPSLAAGNGVSLAAAFQGIGESLSAIGNDVANATIVGSKQPVAAQSAPQAPSTNPRAVAEQSPSPVSAPSAAQGSGTAPSAGVSANVAPNGANPALAQVSSSFSVAHLNWPLVVVIVLILAAIALWLFWPGEVEDGKNLAVSTVTASSPAASAKPLASIAASPAPAPAPIAKQSPLAASVSAPAVKQPSQPEHRPSQSSQNNPQDEKRGSAMPQQQRKPA